VLLLLLERLHLFHYLLNTGENPRIDSLVWVVAAAVALLLEGIALVFWDPLFMSCGGGMVFDFVEDVDFGGCNEHILPGTTERQPFAQYMYGAFHLPRLGPSWSAISPRRIRCKLVGTVLWQW
jgi:hypothetical protein